MRQTQHSIAHSMIQITIAFHISKTNSDFWAKRNIDLPKKAEHFCLKHKRVARATSLRHHKRVSAASNKAKAAVLQLLSYAVGMTICAKGTKTCSRHGLCQALVLLVTERLSLNIRITFRPSLVANQCLLSSHNMTILSTAHQHWAYIPRV
jgi:hypothetical protein